MSAKLKGGVQAGQFDQRVDLYQVSQGQDSAGGETRTPSPADIASGATPNFSAWAYIMPYQGLIEQQDERQIAENWFITGIRYHKSRMPGPGWLIRFRLTGLVAEIRAVESIQFGRVKVELTCRSIQ